MCRIPSIKHGKQTAFSGPMFDRQEIRGSEIVLHFQHGESGLMIAEKEGLAEPRETVNRELSNFEVADSSGKWLSATAKIQGKAVVVICPEVASPIAARYAYSVSPDNCNLYNRDGLPASPFCSQVGLLRYDPMLPE